MPGWAVPGWAVHMTPRPAPASWQQLSTRVQLRFTTRPPPSTACPAGRPGAHPLQAAGGQGGGAGEGRARALAGAPRALQCPRTRWLARSPGLCLRAVPGSLHAVLLRRCAAAPESPPLRTRRHPASKQPILLASPPCLPAPQLVKLRKLDAGSKKLLLSRVYRGTEDEGLGFFARVRERLDRWVLPSGGCFWWGLLAGAGGCWWALLVGAAAGAWALPAYWLAAELAAGCCPRAPRRLRLLR